jgi:signal transduction histidine kinase
MDIFKYIGKIKRREIFNNAKIGIGLAYCKNTINKMKGDIFCDSIKGIGSKFTFFIRVECLYNFQSFSDLNH